MYLLIIFLQRCSVELFVDFFWVPALKMGQILEVESYLKSLDPSLELWQSYLTAACRYFTQKGLYSVLYHTQLLMNVSIRDNLQYNNNILHHHYIITFSIDYRTRLELE